MKDFRLLNAMDTTMYGTNQRVAVLELAEVRYTNIELPQSGLTPYTFDASGQRFVFDFHSPLAQEIIQQGQDEEIIQLDLSLFKLITDAIRPGKEKIYYHSSVRRP